jgi:hypothetical protein
VGLLTQGAAASSGIEIDYIWNNVAYIGTLPNPPIPFQFDSVSTTNSKCEIHAWNNTVVGGAGTCMRTVSRGNGNFGVLDIQNNHCISNVAAPTGIISLGVTGNTYTNLNNVLQTLAVATAQGYTPSEPFAYSPTAGGATISAGLNLTALAAGATISLLQDTTFGGSRATKPRPASGAWDAGAYEFVVGTKPTPPTNLTITVI